ncbi:S-M checkpoint control protein rad4 [Varanus komodoensis]|nr:S-M checkpoint control protein rad4 [Varanus komodoensis]
MCVWTEGTQREQAFVMDKDFAPSPRRSRRCLPTLGAPSAPSRIPGLSVRSAGSGGRAALSPILKKEACCNPFMQDSIKQNPSVKGRGIPRAYSRLGPPKPPRSHELPVSYPPPTTSQPLRWTAANGLEPRKLSSISFTLHRSSNVPPSGRQLLLHSMAKREFQKVSLKTEAPRKAGEWPSPSPQPLTEIQTLSRRVTGISTNDGQICSEGESPMSDAEMPDSQWNLAPPSLPSSPPPSPWPYPQTIQSVPLNSALKETVQDDLVLNNSNGVPKDLGTLQGLPDSGTLALVGQVVGNFFTSDPPVSPVTNTAGVEFWYVQ